MHSLWWTSHACKLFYMFSIVNCRIFVNMPNQIDSINSLWYSMLSEWFLNSMKCYIFKWKYKQPLPQKRVDHTVKPYLSVYIHPIKFLAYFFLENFLKCVRRDFPFEAVSVSPLINILFISILYILTTHKWICMKFCSHFFKGTTLYMYA